MLLQGRPGAVGVAPLARVEDAPVVFLERRGLAEQRPLHPLVALHAAAQMLDESALPGPVGRPEEDPVELAVEVRSSFWLLDGAKRGVQRLRPGQIGGRESRHGPREEIPLYQGAQLVRFPQSLSGQGGNEGAAVGTYDHEPLGLQPPEGLSNRDPTDPEPRGDFLLANGLSRNEDSALYILA